MESHLRTVLKTVSYRFFGAIVTFAVAFFVTSEVKISAGIGIADTLFKLVAYYGHERVWMKVNFGKLKKFGYEG